MSYEPRFTIRPRLLSLVEAIAALRERIQGAAVELSWVPALQKDTRNRNVHASTAIEGNPLTLEQVRALEEGREMQRRQRAVQPRGAELFRRPALYREAREKKGHPARGHLRVAPDTGGYRDGPGQRGQLPPDFRAGGQSLPAGCRRCLGPDVRVAGVVEQDVRRAVPGAQLRHPALPVRAHPSLCRWQRPHRPGARPVGALPARLRQPSHFLRR